MLDYSDSQPAFSKPGAGPKPILLLFERNSLADEEVSDALCQTSRVGESQHRRRYVHECLLPNAWRKEQKQNTAHSAVRLTLKTDLHLRERTDSPVFRLIHGV
ncbi:hypothetical protein MRX96_059717 [Rhipicephalus microplus]